MAGTARARVQDSADPLRPERPGVWCSWSTWPWGDRPLKSGTPLHPKPLAARRLDCCGFGAPAHRLCRGLGPADPPGCGRLGPPSPCPCSPQRGDWVRSSPRCLGRCFPGAPAGLTQGLPGWPGAPQRSIDRREELVERHGGFLAPVGKVLPASRRGDPFPATLPPEWPRLFIRSRGCSAAFEGVAPAKCRMTARHRRRCHSNIPSGSPSTCRTTTFWIESQATAVSVTEPSTA